METNFVLEMVFAQPEAPSCLALLELAEARAIDLVLPAFSLIEAETARHQRHNAVLRFTNGLTVPTELNRLPWLQTQLGSFQGAVSKELSVLGQRLEETSLRVGAIAVTVPLDGETLALRAQARDCGVPPADLTVLASVLRDRREHREGPALFLNRNSKDFALKEVKALLDSVEIELRPSFEGAVGKVRKSLSVA